MTMGLKMKYISIPEIFTHIQAFQIPKSIKTNSFVTSRVNESKGYGGNLSNTSPYLDKVAYKWFQI